MTLDPPPSREFPVPQGIPTSMTLHELALLQRFAHGAGTVLEIGTHYGFSCIGMALAGAHVTSVDPHFEGPVNAPDTWEQFLANLRRHGLRAGVQVEPCHAPIEAVDLVQLANMRPGGGIGYGMAFIDGNHTWPCPWRDAEIAIAHLTDRGYIAFHDVTPNWPGVYRAALQLEAKGWREVGRVQTLRVYQRP